MKKKWLTVGIILLFIGTVIIPSSGQNTEKQSSSRGNWLYVGGSGPGNYTRIQDAINASNEGDTILVYSGTYFENPTISKSLVLVGDNPETTIIDGCQQGNGLTIVSDNITVRGFTIRNATLDDGWEHWAIKIKEDGNRLIRNFDISHCIITSNSGGGILIQNVSNCIITNCTIYNNTYISLAIRSESNDIIIENSTFFNNGKQINENTYYLGGIEICSYENNILSTNVNIENCSLHHNIGDGISLYYSSNISIYHSKIYNNSMRGIAIGVKSTNIELHHNRIFENQWIGIEISDSFTFFRRLVRSIHNILIDNNTITQNGDGTQLFAQGGIIFNYCRNGACILNNQIISNNKYGVFFYHSNFHKVIENNFINNTINASFDARSFWNKWDGNYWDDWGGIGPEKIVGKLWGPYSKNWYNFDWHPAQKPYDIPGMK